jgi:hypothetical protein
MHAIWWVIRRFGGTYRFHLKCRRIRQGRNQHEAGSKKILLTFNGLQCVMSQKTELSVVEPPMKSQPYVDQGLHCCYAARNFIWKSRHWTRFWFTWIQRRCLHINYSRSVLILMSSPLLCFLNDFIQWGFPTKILYAVLISYIRTKCPATFILLDFITFIKWGQEYS